VALKPGDAFGRYLVEGLLGEGGMGQVYRAFDPLLERRVAIKLLRQEPAGVASASTSSDPASAGSARILREARAAAQLHHPNATTIFDVGEVDGVPYLTMELIAGRPLQALVNDATISTGVRLQWLADVARALAAAHERGLVHRDVKLDNVMVRSDGVVKVLDFGIARRDTAEVNPTGSTAPLVPAAITSRSGISGTPLYMSPEQLRGAAVDARTDQFSWGVLAYVLLTGQYPWTDPNNMVRVIAEILDATPAPPSHRAADVPAWVDQVVLKALAKSPSDRFTTMGDLLAALDPAVASAKTMPSVSVPPLRELAASSESRGPCDAAVHTGSGVHRTAPRLTSVPPPGPSRKPALLLYAPFALVALVAGAAALHAAFSRDAHRPPTSQAAVPPAPPPSATAVTALPAPASTNAEALAAHAEGMQAIRDANFDVALRAFERAVKADPGFAAGWMRVAMVGYGVVPLSEAREAFQKAMERRSSLSERDKAFLDTFDPFISREPADLADAERRLAAAVARWPLDGELVEALAYVQLKRGRFAEVIATADRAIAIDPDFADPWSLKGSALAQLGRFPEALGALERCAERFPAATDCLKVEADILEQQGECARMEAVARRWLAKQPTSAGALTALATSLVAIGKHRDSVIAVLEQKWARVEPAGRAAVELADRLPLDVLGGDLAAAELKARELERLTAADSNEAAHRAPSTYLVELLHETGRDAEAGRFAAGFLRRREAWIADAGSDVGLDPSPTMLRAQVRAELLAPAELGSRRGAFLASWEKTLPHSLRGSLWISGYARAAETPDHAREALSVLPDYLPLPPFVPHVLADAELGRVRLLAGDATQATAPLQRATTSCRAYDEPFAHTRAFARLGEALEATGDAAGACRAYSVVLARWGKATVLAVTAERARARAAALACGAAASTR
jgi:serine/threonine-protein kinase